MVSGKNKALKYQEVIDVLEEQILEGKYSLGQKIPTQNELTEYFGVSRPTIEKALEYLEQQGLVQRRKGSGTFVRYDQDKKNLKLKFAFIALRPPKDYDFESNFVQLFVSNFSAESKKRNFELIIDVSIISNSEQLFSHSLKSCKDIIDSGVNGVFMLPVDFAGKDTTVNRALADAFDSADIPVVLLDRDVFQMPERSPYDIVGINNRRGSFVITNHLINNGAEDVYFVTCPLNSNVVSDRIDGFKSAVEYNGLDSRNRIIYDYDYRGQNPGMEILKKFIEQSQQPVGFVCLNDEAASVLIRDVVKMGFDVPRQVRVAGFDDLPTSSLLFSPLTTIRQPVEAIVQTAVNVMENRLQDPAMPAREIYVAEKLIIRESCGRDAAQ
ncbi:MAG: GntR family transcriptional regulator [Sedimentisphaeraceae bacterium JB056]